MNICMVRFSLSGLYIYKITLLQTYRWRSILARGSQLLLPTQDIMAVFFLCTGRRFRPTIDKSVWKRTFGSVLRGI